MRAALPRLFSRLGVSPPPEGKFGRGGGGATPQREDTSSPPPSISLLGKLRPRAESDLQRSWPGPWGSGLPPQRSAPAGGVERVPASRGVPQRLTKAQTHLGSRAGSPRPAQRGSRGCGRPGGPAPILVRGRCAPRSRAAPTSRPEPGLVGARPASLPVTPRAALPQEGPGGSFASRAGQTGWAALPGPPG